VNPPELFELQLFNGKEYAPLMAGERRALETPFEQAAGLRAPRRIVKVSKERPARPRYTVPRGGTSGSMSPDQTVRAYLDWCIAHDVAPTFYAEKYYRAWWPNDKPCRLVPMADFLGDAPEPEPDPE